MHAYLIVGTDQESTQAKIGELAKRFKVKTFEFPLAKIEDTRYLNSFLKLALATPTAVIINSIEKATLEASNAFLKNLEEPQEGLYFILTTESVHKVLPTIVSRCQVIKLQNTRYQILDTKIDKFLDISVGEKLALTDQIRDREEAKLFVRNLIETLHQKLHKVDGEFSKIANYLEAAQKTLQALNANGNVTLQLTNLIIQLK